MDHYTDKFGNFHHFYCNPNPSGISNKSSSGSSVSSGSSSGWNKGTNTSDHHYTILQQRSQLPILQHYHTIVNTVYNNRVVVVSGDTGKYNM